MNSPIWVARCKSGYQWMNRQGVLKTCNATTRRGMLMCDTCLEAKAYALEVTARRQEGIRVPAGLVAAGIVLLIAMAFSFPAVLEGWAK